MEGDPAVLMILVGVVMGLLGRVAAIQVMVLWREWRSRQPQTPLLCKWGWHSWGKRFFVECPPMLPHDDSGLVAYMPSVACQRCKRCGHVRCFPRLIGAFNARGTVRYSPEGAERIAAELTGQSPPMRLKPEQRGRMV